MESRQHLMLSGIAAVVVFTCPAHAALLLYEGFNGYTSGANATAITPNGSTIGLSDSYANAATSNAPTNFTASSTGISFGPLQTSGGSLLIGGGTGVAQSAITTTTSSGQIWGSYLINLSTNSEASSAGFEVRLNSTIDSVPANAYFRSSADTRGGTSANPAIAYDNGLGTPADAALILNTNYIIISRYDTGDSGGATLWALNLAQFQAFVDAGRTETFLGVASNVTATATDAKAGTRGWNAPTAAAYLEIVSSNVAGRMDEVRFGETLLDVTPLIPEPSHTMLSAFGLLGLLARRTRR